MDSPSFGRAYQQCTAAAVSDASDAFSDMSRPVQFAHRLTSCSHRFFRASCCGHHTFLDPIQELCFPLRRLHRRAVFFSSRLWAQYRLVRFSIQYIALYRSPTYLDTLIATTTPMTQSSRLARFAAVLPVKFLSATGLGTSRNSPCFVYYPGQHYAVLRSIYPLSVPTEITHTLRQLSYTHVQ